MSSILIRNLTCGRLEGKYFLLLTTVTLLSALSQPGCQPKEESYELRIHTCVSWSVSEYMFHPLIIGNPSSFDIVFDTIQIEFDRQDKATKDLIKLTIQFSQGKMIQAFDYFGQKVKDLENKEIPGHGKITLEKKKIGGRKAIMIPFISVPARPSRLGGETTKINIVLLREGKHVGKVQRASLPPIEEIPETVELYHMGKPRFPGAKGVPMEFKPD